MKYGNEVKDKTIHELRKGNEYSFEIVGEVKEIPEIDSVAFDGGDVGTMVVFYDLNKFQIKSHNSGKELDLIGATPPGWSQKVIDIFDIEKEPPEIVLLFEKYQKIDAKNQECLTASVVGGFDPKNTDNAVKIALWNTLIARFLQEIGEPMNEEGGKGMREVVQKRRDEILEILNEKNDKNPQEILLKSFSNAEQFSEN
jgi:hypothetical protein